MGLVFYVPSMNGDVRFSAVDEGTEVTVHDPTAAETDAVEKLLRICKDKGWTDLVEIPKPTGRLKRWRKSTFVIRGPIADVGDEFVKLVRPARSSITALRFKDGEVHVEEAGGTKKLLKVAEERKAEEPEARAVAVKRPTMCCPACVPGAIGPASEVLLDFLDPQQHKDWARHRTIEVEGGTTGHRYLVAHRHSPAAVRFGRVAFDADDAATLHFHDISVPPEEEVLGAMLLLKHRESWVRNEASCLGASFTHVLKNPFGGVMDGVESAAMMAGIGGFLATTAVMTGTASPEMSRMIETELARDLGEIATRYF